MFDRQPQLLPIGMYNFVCAEPPLPVGCCQPVAEHDGDTEAGPSWRSRTPPVMILVQGVPMGMAEPFLQLNNSPRLFLPNLPSHPSPSPSLQA